MTIDAAAITETGSETESDDLNGSEIADEPVLDDLGHRAGATSPETADRRTSRRASGGARGPRRSSKLRRTVERALGVAGLDVATCELLAVALDVGGDPGDGGFLVDLAVAALEDPRSARETLSALVELSDVDDLEAGVLATGMVAERAAFRRLWSVLRAVEPSLPATIPQKATQAGAAVARCARGLTKAQRAALERAIGALA